MANTDWPCGHIFQHSLGAAEATLFYGFRWRVTEGWRSWLSVGYRRWGGGSQEGELHNNWWAALPSEEICYCKGQKYPDVHKIVLSIKLRPHPPKKRQFWGFSTDLHSFPYFGPFSVGGGGTKFCGQEFYGHPEFSEKEVLLELDISRGPPPCMRAKWGRFVIFPVLCLPTFGDAALKS